MISQEKINRFEFLKSLGLRGAALLAVYGMGSGVSSCKKDEGVLPGPITGFSLDLTATANAALKNVGGYIIQNKVVVARVSTSSYVAVTQVCSHEGLLKVVFKNGEFYCGEHDARFSTTGAGLNGNASKGLTVYQTTLSGNTLTVSA